MKALLSCMRPSRQRVQHGFQLGVILMGSLAVALTPAARADSFTFAFNGGGMSGSGVLTVSNTPVPGVPGGRQITGITGTFSDSNLGISNAAILGVVPAGLPSPINSDGTFLPTGDAATFGFSSDNLFYSAANSPAVCPPPPPGDPHEPYPFGGGLFDIYGLLFNVQGGYSVDLWSNGVVPGFGLTYGVGDSKDGTVLSTFGEPFSGTSVSVTATPEPGSFLLLGTGAMAALGMMRRRLFS
jgi:PEP-CTERM motif